MRAFALAFVIGLLPIQHSLTSPSTPPTFTPSGMQRRELEVPQILRPTTKTTPGLTEETIHLGMEKDISGQGESIGQLKEKVGSLEKKREEIDRPDIESLKDTRNHYAWVWSVGGGALGMAIAIFWFFKRVIWSDILKPRLKRELIEVATSESTSS